MSCVKVYGCPAPTNSSWTSRGSTAVPLNTQSALRSAMPEVLSWAVAGHGERRVGEAPAAPRGAGRSPRAARAPCSGRPRTRAAGRRRGGDDDDRHDEEPLVAEADHARPRSILRGAGGPVSNGCRRRATVPSLHDRHRGRTHSCAASTAGGTSFSAQRVRGARHEPADAGVGGEAGDGVGFAVGGVAGAQLRGPSVRGSAALYQASCSSRPTPAANSAVAGSVLCRWPARSASSTR